MVNTDLLEQAAARAKTGWLEQELKRLLPQVWSLTIESPNWRAIAAAWASQIDQMFEQKKLITPNQQKNRRTDIANALRTIDPDHPVIPFVLLPTSVYTALNQEQAHRLNARENKFFSSQQAHELVERAILLLDHPSPEEVAAGLAVLVGRRISEILVSQFRPKTAYSLLFSEAVKRRGKIPLAFEIPTLAPAERILTAIEKLQQIWNIADLKSMDLPDNILRRRINARYSGVPAACRRHFADLIPGREADTDQGNRLYTHLFRAVYTEIATYFYKPEWVPDYRFKAEIQGHFKLTNDGQKIPNYSARQNYDDYLIRDRAPSQAGIKLGLPGVTILEVFQKEDSMVEEPGESAPLCTLDRGTINALLYRAVDQLLFSKQWADIVTGLMLVSGRSPEVLLSTTLKPKTQFTLWFDDLEVPTLTGASQVIAAWTKFCQMAPLSLEQWQAAIQEVCQKTFQDLAPIRSEYDLQAVYSCIAIHWFCPPEIEEIVFLDAIAAVTPITFQTAHPKRGIKLGQRNIQVLDQFKHQIQQQLSEEEVGVAAASSAIPESDTPLDATSVRSRHRRKTLTVDIDLLRTVAASFGIRLRGKGVSGGVSYETALAEVLAQLGQESSRQISSTPPLSSPEVKAEWTIAITDQAKTLAWMTNRLDALEQEIESLKRERDELRHEVRQAAQSPELTRLLQENHQLQQERNQAMAKLEAFRQLLNGGTPATGLRQPQKDATELSENHATQQIEASTAFPVEPSRLEAGPSEPKATRKRTSEEDALQNIRLAVRAIMAFNDQDALTNNDRWYISFPVVQTLLRANEMSANQKNVATIFEELKEELEQHHDRHGLGSRHNRRHPELSKIAQIVHLSCSDFQVNGH